MDLLLEKVVSQDTTIKEMVLSMKDAVSSLSVLIHREMERKESYNRELIQIAKMVQDVSACAQSRSYSSILQHHPVPHDSSSNWCPPLTVQDTDGPPHRHEEKTHHLSLAEVMKLVANGETPPGIIDVEDRVSTDASNLLPQVLQVVSSPHQGKPWENKGQLAVTRGTY
jgi:hypothetical protein